MKFVSLRKLQRRIVIPAAAYVELRALEIERQALDELGPTPFKPGSRVLRLWPFRWPTHQAEMLRLPPIEEESGHVGGYIDLLF